MLNKNIITQLEKIYDISICSISSLRESSDNYVYLIETKKNKYISRMSKRDIRDDVLFETTWLDFLFNQRLPVVEVVKTVDKNLFTLFHNAVLVLFHFAKGHHTEITPNKKPNLVKIENAAYELAKIHNVSFNSNIDVPRKRNILIEIKRALDMKSKFIKNSVGGDDFVNNLLFYKTWGEANENNRYLLHNDYHAGNILFDGNEVAAILDFDWSCKGPAIKDVAHSLVEWSFPDGAEKHWEDVFNIFLESYNKKTRQQISIDETLYHWICFSCLSDTATFFTDLASKNAYMEISKSYMYKKLLYFKEYLK